MRLKLIILGLTYVYVSAQNSDTVEEAIVWLNDLYASTDTGVDSRNTELSPTTGNGPTTCVTDRMESGICVNTTLCATTTQTDPTPDPTTLFILRESSPCKPTQSCCLQKNINNVLIPMATNLHDKCGISNPGANAIRESVLLAGFADFGEFPWMVALIRKGTENNDWDKIYAGGGALIHPSVVITAAHKVADYDPNELKIRAGEWESNHELEVYPYQERDVSKIILHENYFPLHAHNNVALLILKSPVDLSDAPHIGIACLAPELPPPGTRCYGMGWGKNSMDNDRYVNKLKKLELPLVAASECERKFRNTKLGSRFYLHTSLTCAGGEVGVDTCEGDGGSPLVCALPGDSSRFQVVGLVTYGLQCGKKLPGAYLKISEVYDWVGGRLTLEGFNKNSFVYNL